MIEDKLYTVEDFFRLVADGEKADLIDGVIYPAPPVEVPEDRLGYLIRFLLRGYSRKNTGGEVLGSRFTYALALHRAAEPDVSFVSEARRQILTRTRGTAAPDVAVEVVSQDSRDRDYGVKHRLYEEAGVCEYWIIDPAEHRCEFHRLEDGRFLPVSLEQDLIFRSEALPGFWLDIRWLLADPLPDEYQCLDQILAGSPGFPSTSN